MKKDISSKNTYTAGLRIRARRLRKVRWEGDDRSHMLVRVSLEHLPQEELPFAELPSSQGSPEWEGAGLVRGYVPALDPAYARGGLEISERALRARLVRLQEGQGTEYRLVA